MLHYQSNNLLYTFNNWFCVILNEFVNLKRYFLPFASSKLGFQATDCDETRFPFFIGSVFNSLCLFRVMSKIPTNYVQLIAQPLVILRL